jgi:hypothetical protein
MSTFLNIEDSLQNERTEYFKSSRQLSLGSLISKLEAVLSEYPESYAHQVRYDFCDAYPTDIASWRGIYAELALNHIAASEVSNVVQFNLVGFIDFLKQTKGKTFEGYKGGEFTMGKDTPIWVANRRYTGNTAVVGVINTGFSIVLETAYKEAYPK